MNYAKIGYLQNDKKEKMLIFVRICALASYLTSMKQLDL